MHDRERKWAIERRRCLVREILRRADRNGIGWLEQFVRGWKVWPSIRDDFKRQRAAGNRGEFGDWR